jgi:hypothetical protein
MGLFSHFRPWQESFKPILANGWRECTGIRRFALSRCSPLFHNGANN